MISVNAQSEYACLACIELARKGVGPQNIIKCGDLGNACDMPPRFLVQIMIRLKGAGIIGSVRGAAGGYFLAKSPKDISVYDVFLASGDADLLSWNSHSGNSPATIDVFHGCVETIDNVAIDSLKKVTIAKLAKATSER